MRLTLGNNKEQYLPLGGDAIGVMRGKIAKLQEDIAAWENLAGKTAYE